MPVPRHSIIAALSAHDDGFRIIAHWLNSQPALQRANVKIEPCSPRAETTIESCRNRLANAFAGIRSHATEVESDNRKIYPWTLGCLNRAKRGHHLISLHWSEGTEPLEEEIERQVAVYDSYGWTAEDWRVCVKEPVEDHFGAWRSWLNSLAEPAEEDGPFGIDGFRWNGAPCDGLTKKPSLLLHALWKTKHRELSLDDAQRSVYDDDKPEWTDRLRSLCRQINKFFGANAIPKAVKFKGGKLGKIFLVDEPTKQRA